MPDQRVDSVLLNKAASIERCVARARFRNIAVHDNQTLQLAITVAIIKDHLDDFLRYTHCMITGQAA